MDSLASQKDRGDLIRLTDGTRVAASYRQALAVRPFRRILGAHALATLGQLQLTMAVAIDAEARTSSGIWLSVAVALGFAPYVAFSYAAGILADRRSRSQVLRTSIGLRVATGILTALALVAGAPVPVVIALAALTAVAATPAYPALAAVTPQVIPMRQLPAANSLATGVENAAWVAGPGVLGVLLLTGAPVWGGALASVACFTAGLAVLGNTRTPAPTRVPAELPASSPGPLAGQRVGHRHERLRRLREEVTAGARAVAGEPRVLTAFVIAMLDNFVYGYLVVALVLVGTEAMGLAEAGIGVLTTAFAVGALTSFVVNQRLADPGREVVTLVIGMVGFATVTAGLALAESLPVVTALLVLAGLLTLVVEVVAVTLIQRVAPHEVAARVFGLYDTIAVALIAFGSALAGVLSDTVGLADGLIVVASLTAVLTLGCAATMTRARGTTLLDPDPGAVAGEDASP
jgi:MFS family permease